VVHFWRFLLPLVSDSLKGQRKCSIVAVIAAPQNIPTKRAPTSNSNKGNIQSSAWSVMFVFSFFVFSFAFRARLMGEAAGAAKNAAVESIESTIKTFFISGYSY
jgi:hypothetical protein